MTRMAISLMSRRRMVVLVVFLLVSLPLIAQETLTNESVIKMCKAHLGVGVIVNAIRTTPGHYSLGASNLIELKTQGVPDQVIAAMQTATADQPANRPPASEAAGPAPSAVGTLETWVAQDLHDAMSGTTATVAKTSIRGGHGGVLTLVAHCDNDLSLELYVAPATSGLAFKRSPMAQHVTTFQGPNGQVTGGVASPPAYCAVFQVKAGDGPVQEMTSQLCDDDTNTELIFPGDATKVARANYKTIGNMISPGVDNDASDKAMSDVGAMIGEIGAQMAGKVTPQLDAMVGIIRMPDVVSADFLRIELPFASGQRPIIEIHPKAPVLKSYLAGCMAASPPSPPKIADVPPAKRGPSIQKTMDDFYKIGPGHTERCV